MIPYLIGMESLGGDFFKSGNIGGIILARPKKRHNHAYDGGLGYNTPTYTNNEGFKVDALA